MTPSQFKQLRRRLGMTQEELAKALDRSVWSIVGWEKGKSPIPKTVGMAVRHLVQQHEATKENTG